VGEIPIKGVGTRVEGEIMQVRARALRLKRAE
jgi:hypothetical protein